jgi:hypothetical protein
MYQVKKQNYQEPEKTESDQRKRCCNLFESFLVVPDEDSRLYPIDLKSR